MYKKNGLANHAAAGAYGFLLSAAPMLLMVSFFLIVAFRSSPQAVAALIKNLPFPDIVFDEKWLERDFFSVSLPGISGVISALSVFWAGRIFALSLQRGLNVIFPGEKKEKPLRGSLVTLAIEAVALIFALILIMGSQTALRLYEVFNFPSFFHAASIFQYRIFPVILMWLVAFCAYRLIPLNSPGRLSAFWGSVFFVFLFQCTYMVMGILLELTRYNFLYGALGNLIILLINVYFFFLFFFLGAQLAFVLDYFDALLFAKMRQTRIKTSAKRPALFERRLFFHIEGHLKKYCRVHKQGETIFSKGDSTDEIYFILDGEVMVIISSLQNAESFTSVLEPGSFFGEMSYLLSENRSATAKAKTDVNALALPPRLFEEIIRFDSSLDRSIIEHLSRRLKNTSAQIEAMEQAVSPGVMRSAEFAGFPERSAGHHRDKQQSY
jgi:membrane protein